MIIKLEKIVYTKDELSKAIKQELNSRKIEFEDASPLLVISSTNQPVYIKDTRSEYIFGYNKLRHVTYIEYLDKFKGTLLKGDNNCDSLFITNAIENLNDRNKEVDRLKFSVSPEESEIIQFILEHYYGCRWGTNKNGPVKIKNLEMPFLYFKNKRIMYGQVLRSFDEETEFKEYDFSSFIKDYYVFKNK
jgi:hypothetical protein